jgi:hypothetical protein
MNEASGGEYLKGVSPKLIRNSPEDPVKAGDSHAAAMLSNATPLGAEKLPLTDTLMLAQPTVPMSIANPIT